ncbi:MAG: crossover junction endodeoxyribonuclease RuvC [Candidatus Peregrinibacteria bacterium]
MQKCPKGWSRILGIDPGLATVGLGIVERHENGDIRPLDWLTIQTAAGLEASDRLEEIAHDLKEYLQEYSPELAVVERLYFSKNVRTAMAVAQARGVILLTLASAGIPCLEPNPLSLKSCITGDGRADKKQIQDMLVMRLKLQEIPKPDDAADALALALYGALQPVAVA